MQVVDDTIILKDDIHVFSLYLDELLSEIRFFLCLVLTGVNRDFCFFGANDVILTLVEIKYKFVFILYLSKHVSHFGIRTPLNMINDHLNCE